jgi:hypothetical protein
MPTLKSFYRGNADYGYNFHISRDPAFIYVNNPKCGCSTAKASLNRWHAAWHGKVLEHKSMGDVHSRGFNPLLGPGALGPDAETLITSDPGYFRFTLLRDPLSRLASAYENKLSWNSPERQELNRLAGRDLDQDVPFELFLEQVATSPASLDMNEHWRPQTRQVAAPVLPYDFFCLFDTLSADLLTVRNRLFPGLAIGVFETREHFPEVSSNSAARLARFTAAQFSLIHDLYAEDFALYNAVKTARAG